MERKEFLRKLGLTMVVAPLMSACSAEDDPAADNLDSNNNGACTTTPSETAGPYPTKDPTSLIMEDIRSDRQGVTMNAQITIKDKNTNCATLEGVVVDIWHCDKDGNYSEYGGSSAVHFLRGRQASTAEGLVGFTTIFPGWYSGRSPHIHVHVYDSSGKSLLVTQIAFPKDVCDTVYTTSSFYSSRGKADTTNEPDGIFANGYTNELALLSGNVTDGYTLTHTIVVEA